jgi:hypothetical protein
LGSRITDRLYAKFFGRSERAKLFTRRIDIKCYGVRPSSQTLAT